MKIIKSVTGGINTLLVKFFGLRVVGTVADEYRTRVHPYHRISNVVKNLFENDDITLFEVGVNTGGIIDLFLSMPNNINIIGLEPNIDLFSFLKNKYKDVDNVELYNNALSDDKGTLDFYITKSDNLSSFIEPLEKTEALSVREKVEVEVVSGDEFCELHHSEKIDVLSINVQGFEKKVLQGFSKSFENRRVKSIIVEIDFSDRYEPTSFYDIENIIKKYGFYLFEINLIKIDNSQNEKYPVGIKMVDCFYVLKNHEKLT
jgi:FkbM family methyltransferase